MSARATHFFLSGSFLQVGNCNIQKIKIGKAVAHELDKQLGVCRRALEQSQQLVAVKDNINTSKDVLIASKVGTFSLLRGDYTQPNKNLWKSSLS